MHTVGGNGTTAGTQKAFTEYACNYPGCNRMWDRVAGLCQNANAENNSTSSCSGSRLWTPPTATTVPPSVSQGVRRSCLVVTMNPQPRAQPGAPFRNFCPVPETRNFLHRHSECRPQARTFSHRHFRCGPQARTGTVSAGRRPAPSSTFTLGHMAERRSGGLQGDSVCVYSG